MSKANSATPFTDTDCILPASSRRGLVRSNVRHPIIEDHILAHRLPVTTTASTGCFTGHKAPCHEVASQPITWRPHMQAHPHVVACCLAMTCSMEASSLRGQEHSNHSDGLSRSILAQDTTTSTPIDKAETRSQTKKLTPLLKHRDQHGPIRTTI